MGAISSEIVHLNRWAIILLAEDLLHPFHTNMDLIKILENLMLICS